MIGALLYLQLESIKNRLRMRLRRLKKPKYLAGAAVGAAYFYFFFFRNLFGGRRSVAAVWRWVKLAVPAPAASDFADLEALKYYLRHAMESGPALYALIPFRLVVRPYLAPDAAAFVVASM